MVELFLIGEVEVFVVVVNRDRIRPNLDLNLSRSWLNGNPIRRGSGDNETWHKDLLLTRVVPEPYVHRVVKSTTMGFVYHQAIDKVDLVAGFEMGQQLTPQMTRSCVDDLGLPIIVNYPLCSITHYSVRRKFPLVAGKSGSCSNGRNANKNFHAIFNGSLWDAQRLTRTSRCDNADNRVFADRLDNVKQVWVDFHRLAKLNRYCNGTKTNN